MPIYEYRCPKCGHELEVMQKVDAPAPGSCPSCKAETPLERLVSRSSFHLKGGGWYSDLYGSAKKDSAKSDAPAKSDSSSSGTTSSTTAGASSATSGGSSSGSSSTSAPAASTGSSSSSGTGKP